MKRMIFMGSDPIALPALEEIAVNWTERVWIVACYTQPDRPAGRGKKLRENAIKFWARERGIPVRQPERIGEDDVAFLRDSKCDVVLVMAYGHILRKGFLETPPRGAFNLHASLLPKYRGAAPLNAAIAAGETETGVTLMGMVRKMDAGPVADSERFPITRLDTAGNIAEKAAAACVPLLARNLDAILEGKIELNEQIEREASYTRKLEKGDGVLDFTASAATLARRVNALYPWPSCQVEVEGERLRFGLADFEESEPVGRPGVVVESREVLAIATTDGVLKVLRIQRPGGRMMEARDFLLGFPIPEGTHLPSHPMPELVTFQT